MIRDEILPRLAADNHALAQQIARVPERIRGYGHVKLGNLATGRAQWRVLLDQWHGRDGDSATKPGANERGRVIPISVA
jgi:indolepyruvate ferredoxin oxidoreductase